MIEIQEDNEMYGYISGMTDNNDISFCPRCGAEIMEFYGDGTAECEECGYHFGVVECEEQNSEIKRRKRIYER